MTDDIQIPNGECLTCLSLKELRIGQKFEVVSAIRLFDNPRPKVFGLDSRVALILIEDSRND